jgi:hypothetical protein
MRTVTRVVIAAALAFGLGCAQTDWIDRTLVTVDVTGTWYGSVGGPGLTGDLFLELKQEGSRVTGFLRTSPSGLGRGAGTFEGTVAGDVFRFRDSKNRLEGEVTISGDEMNGRASFIEGSRPISLRRVDSSSRPASPPR